MKFFWSTSLALLALLSCSENNAGNTTETTNAVSGIIKDKDGKILPNNPILLRQIDSLKNVSDELNFISDENGKFNQELEPGFWSIEVYNQDSTQGLINSQQIEKSTDLGVLNLSNTLNLNGKIDNSTNVYSIVKLYQNQRSAPISRDGSFQFSQLPKGIYEISISNDSGVIIDTLDLTYAPDSLNIEWEDTQKVNLKKADTNSAKIRAYWNFDDNLLDQGPDSIYGQLAGNVKYVPGKLNTGIQFISRTSIHFGEKKSLLEINKNQDFGFSMWIKVKVDSAQSQYGILNIQPSIMGANGFNLILDTKSKKITLDEVGFGIFNEKLLSLPFDFKSDTWHHIALYRQGNLYGVEIDRTFIQQHFAIKASSFVDGWLILGADHLFQYFFTNQLDELYFFDSAPNKTLLDSLYNNAKL